MAEPTPMPEIEVGDWFEHRVGSELRIGRCFHEDDARNINALEVTKSIVTEIRKADGRIWRREDPPR